MKSIALASVVISVAFVAQSAAESPLTLNDAYKDVKNLKVFQQARTA